LFNKKILSKVCISVPGRFRLLLPTQDGRNRASEAGQDRARHRLKQGAGIVHRQDCRAEDGTNGRPLVRRVSFSIVTTTGTWRSMMEGA
jgi:hypothetical protein